jgi:hypothetical protein
MTSNRQLPISTFRILERTAGSIPKLLDLHENIHSALSSLQLPAHSLFGKRIAVSVGSRGIRDVAKVVRSVCDWLRA